MRQFLICFIFVCTFTSVKGQNEALAKNYFEQGEYQKALSIFEKLAQRNPGHANYAMFMIKCHQQLENYQEAENLIRLKTDGRRVFPQFFVELGYNFQLQGKDSLAGVSFEQAFKAIEEKPIYAYVVGRTFSDYSLLDEAAAVFELAMKLDPSKDYHSMLAKIYGEQGKLEKMFEAYIEIIRTNATYRPSAQRTFAYYVNEDPNNEANVILRRTLLKKLQDNPDVLYNELLSWLFIQQKEFKKAFVQEKAIYKRNNEDLTGIIDLLMIAMDEQAFDDAEAIAQFVIDNADRIDTKIEGHQYLMDIKLLLAAPEDYPKIETGYQEFLDQFGNGPATRSIQLDYNKFLAFKFDKSSEAIENLKQLLKNDLPVYQEARVKIELADILVFEEKFNEALIYYSQVQKKVKSDLLAQEARFKVAQTSYFKGDFEWAQVQLDVLKKSASQLIANDAMQLSLMIRDNSLEDSTQTALKKFARADLLKLQNKPQKALIILADILEYHKGEKIEDEALLQQGKLLASIGQLEKAEASFLKLIDLYKDDILADDAYFNLAKLYEDQLQLPAKAKECYEFIIFNFEDSIYFVDARKRYRSLRGDAIN